MTGSTPPMTGDRPSAPADPAGRAEGGTLSAGSARSLLLTVLGELVWPQATTAWTSSLLYVLTGLGIEERTARQAIARGAAAGWITGQRLGREVQWTLTARGRQLIEEGSARVTSIGAGARGWDGQWLVLQVTIPHSYRTARNRLYAGLRWAGFGNPTPGVWISPHPDRCDEAARLITELDLGATTLSFVGPAAGVGLSDREIVSRSWDLETLTERFDAQLAALEMLDPEPGDATLFTHVRVVSQWQRSPFSDPQLPEELLPNWIGQRVSARFAELRERWSDAAHQRWREIESAQRPPAQ